LLIEKLTWGSLVLTDGYISFSTEQLSLKKQR